MADDQIKTRMAANGFDPGFTAIPNQLLDMFIPFLSAAEVRVLLYVLRRTFGFGKQLDGISLRQICEGVVSLTGRRLDYGTGLSKPAVIEAIRVLGGCGLLFSQAPSKKGKGSVKVYAVVLTGRAKKIVDESRGGSEKVSRINPSSPAQKGQHAHGVSGNSANPSGPERVSPANTQKKVSSGNKDYSKDETGRELIYDQNAKQNQIPTSPEITGAPEDSSHRHYDYSPEFSQIEATYRNPDPESDDAEAEY